MGRFLSRFLHGAHGAYEGWRSIHERWWYVGGALLLSFIFTGPRQFIEDRVKNVNAFLHLPDQLWGKWLIIGVAFCMISWGVWRSSKRIATDEAEKARALSHAMELPTLAVALPAIAALLAELRTAVTAEKMIADGYIRQLQSLATGEPITHHRKTPLLPRFEGEFRASASSIFGTGIVARPSPLTGNPYETAVPVVDAQPHLCYDPSDPANIPFVRDVQGKISETEHYKEKLDDIEREASRKFDVLHLSFLEKAKNHGYSQLGSL